MASGKAKEVPVRAGGKVRHVRVDNNALCIVEEITGVSLLDGVANPGMRVLRALCYGALVSGARATGGRRDFTVEDVGDWMEETPELLEAVLQMVQPAMPEAPPGPRVVPEEPAAQVPA